MQHARFDGLGRGPPRVWTGFAIGVAAGLVVGGLLLFFTGSWVWAGLAAGGFLLLALAGLIGANERLVSAATGNEVAVLSRGGDGAGSAPDSSGNIPGA